MMLHPVIGLWSCCPHSVPCPAPQGLQPTLCVQIMLWPVGDNIFSFSTSEPSLRPFTFSNPFWREHQHYIQHYSRSTLHRSLSCMYSLMPLFIYSFVQYMLFNTYSGWGPELSPENLDRKKIIFLSFCFHRRKQEIDKYLW